MKNRLTILTAVLLSATVAAPAFAQGGYHYNYGSSRVVNQGSVGYNMHEFTYIPTGAINSTAKGKITGGIGQEANPNLPGVKWGRTVGTSGDNFYQGAAPDKYKSAVPTYAQTPQKTITLGGQRQGGRMYYQQRPQQQQGYAYTPGQNGSAAGYAYNGGTATYAETKTNGK